ncbi:RHS repeat domain-containing protein [Saccharicrinis fermentans]|uniref:Cell wall-associated polypeptide CWBP200 n=1 Tax=Saccharicrinis fermentans DSM 9555 = JCM 21142 TaxID=869213 RepID=W7Y1M4_9BACT|nr:RHS repeat-associated core domain-containing protein [Saccharicrinis fermentans]GAF04795.1 cell wall-associated polypeptide CWBP200 [Saccharicrinis fermentans DSM 9555 = JCM 21142]
MGSNELNIVYGIDKQRRKSVFSGGLTRYYFNNYEEDYSGNNVKKVHYITGGNGITAMYIETNGVGQLYHLITDYQGSLIAIANKDGEIASFDGSEQKFAYDPWGNRRNPNDWKLIDTRTKWLSDRGYAMHEHLDGFTLINMNGRVYDPMLAQFLSPDPYIQSPDNWLNYNRYTYCLNNPMLYTDPSGEFFGAALPLMVKIGIGIGAAVGGYTGYKIGEANGASGLGMAAYMLGGAAIGGFSGYVGGTVAAGGGIMANTGAIMAGSYTNSMGMAMLSGGDMPPSISFGAGSFNFGTGEFRSIFDWKDLSTMEKIGYGLGALANLNDLINQTSATLYTQERYPDGSKDIISHSGIVDDASTDKLMSFGPNDSKIGAGGFKDQVGGLKPGGGYKKFGLAIRKSTTGYDVPVSLSKFQSVVVNKHLFSGLRGISKIIPYQGATTNCVNMSSIGFWLNGIPNIGIHPYLLHYSTAAYYGGFRPDIFSYYLNNN